MSKESYKAGMDGINERKKHLNRVRKYQSQSDLEPHLIIKGTVKFRNTHGYLSAQKYPNIQYNAYFLALFTCLCFVWTLGMHEYKNKIVAIHWMVAVVLYACWFESLFNLIYYKSMNSTPKDYSGLAIVTIIAEVARNVFSRVIVLLTALGYGITTLDVRAHQINIVVMSFIYAISLILAGASSSMKENYYTQDSTVFIA
jgi:hypothetical protein